MSLNKDEVEVEFAKVWYEKYGLDMVDYDFALKWYVVGYGHGGAKALEMLGQTFGLSTVNIHDRNAPPLPAHDPQQDEQEKHIGKK